MSSSAFSNFLRDLPETLQQPATLAMFGSVVVHLILSATLPAFTSSPEPPQSDVRRVRLLEPPPGVAGAPQAATSRLGLPPVPNSPNNKLQLPQAGQTNPVPNPLYTIPDLNPPSVSNLPQQQQPSQLRTSQDSFNELLRRLAARPQVPIRIPKTPQEKPQQDQDQNQQPQRSPTEGLSRSNPEDIARSTPPGTTPPPPGAPLGTTPQAPRTQAPPAQTFIAKTEQDKFLVATNYNPQGTTSDEFMTAQIGFTDTLKQKGLVWDRIILRKPLDPIQEIPYPLGWKLRDYEKRQNPIAIAVLVDRKGKILDGAKPEILQSSGYSILNQKAEEIVKANATPEKLTPLIQQHEAGKDANALNQIQAYLLVYELKFKAPENPPVSNRPQS